LRPPINQNELEFLRLLDLYKKRKPKRVLEIGTYQGGSLYHWIKNSAENSVIVSVDNQHINYQQYPGWIDNTAQLRYFKGDSHSKEAFNFVKQDAPYDWLFIDGDHSYEGVKQDWLDYGGLVESGVVAFHDILPHSPYEGQPIEVDKLWNEIKKDYLYKEIIEEHDEWEIGPGIGVLFK